MAETRPRPEPDPRDATPAPPSSPPPPASASSAADAAGRPAEASAAPAPEQQRVLLVIILASPEMLDDILTALLDIGVPGTVIESKGLMALLREEMPIFGGLASMLPSTSSSRVLISVTDRAMTKRVFEYMEAEIKPAQRPIAAVLPIEETFGLRH